MRVCECVRPECVSECVRVSKCVCVCAHAITYSCDRRIGTIVWLESLRHRHPVSTLGVVSCYEFNQQQRVCDEARESSGKLQWDRSLCVTAQTFVQCHPYPPSVYLVRSDVVVGQCC